LLVLVLSLSLSLSLSLCMCASCLFNTESLFLLSSNATCFYSRKKKKSNVSTTAQDFSVSVS
jgi:hypothetical protein